jgi:rhamnogalacturonan endolyase
MSIAYLDGKHPAIVTQTGLYENEHFVAYDAALNKLWDWTNSAETTGSGSHRIEIYDVAGDGKDCLMDGTTCLNGDGTVRWSIYREHADNLFMRHFLPDRPGMQIFFTIETPTHSGVYMVDADTGHVIWKHNHEEDPRWIHAHYGWAANILEGGPGIECFTNRDAHFGKQPVLMSPTGEILSETLSVDWLPVEWLGKDSRELVDHKGTKIVQFDGKSLLPVESLPAGGKLERLEVANLMGDFRDEIVLGGKDADGNFGVFIYAPTTVIHTPQVTKTPKHDYQMWLAHNLGGGYNQYFESAR